MDANRGRGVAAARRVLPRPETELSRLPRYRWAGRLGAWLVRLWGWTLRVRWEIPDPVRSLERSGFHLIYTFWHAHILALTYTHRHRSVVVLVSRHGDGEYISQVIHRLGFGTVRGSSSAGGLRSLIEMARLGRAGHPLSVTPDGPRGPRHVLQPGVLIIAQRSGLPIVPLAAGARRCWLLRSWDRFEIPYFFSRVLVAVGEPIFIPSELGQDALLAEYKPKVERALTELEDRVQSWAGRAPGCDQAGRDESAGCPGRRDEGGKSDAPRTNSIGPPSGE